MRKTKITLLLTGFAVFAVLVILNLRLVALPSGASGPSEDPDLPPPQIGQPAVDKGEYLRQRQEYFASLRGWEPGEKFDPHARGRAIVRMEAEQLDLIENMRAAAAQEGPNSRAAEELKISLTAWTELGPAPIPNGQVDTILTGTPVSGRTTAIAVHPTNPNIAYVGTAQGGLYRTVDGGTTWTPMMDNAQSLAIGAVAFAPSDPTILYVGTGEANLSGDSFFGVGLYRITDALGASPVLTGPINPPVATGIPGTTAFSGVSISKVVVHPTDPAIVFVSTASGTSGNPGGGSLNTTVPPVAILGLYRSTNATAPLEEIGFSKLTVTSAGSIAPDTSGNRNIIDVVMEPGVPNNLVLTVLGTNASTPPDGGVYVTNNALAPTPTFTRTLTLGGTTLDANQGRAELAIQKTASLVTVYVASGESSNPAAGAACGTGGTLRRSEDGGNTWLPPLPAANGYCAGQCFYDIALAVDPTNPLVVLLGGNVTGACTKLIARSNDGGATFDPAPAVGVHADNQVVVFAPSDPLVAYMGTDGGIYRSGNGGNTWTPMNNSTYRATQFQSIATHPTDREILIGGTQDNGTIRRTASGGWTRTDSGDGGYALFDRNGTATETALAYHTYQNGGTLIGWARSTNSGTTFSQRNCPANGIPCNEPVLFYAPIALGPGNPNTFYFGTDRLWRSTDGMVVAAASQKPLATDAVPPATPVNQVLTTIAISPFSDNVRLTGLRNGKVFGTSEGSMTLVDLTTPDLPKPNQGTIRRAVSRAIFSTTDPKTAYITFGGYNVEEGEHIWKTTNFDTSAGAPAVVWTPSGFGIPDVPVNSIIIDRLAPNNMYAATDIGVFRSSNSGETWAPFNSGLPRIAIFDLAFQEQQSIPNQTERVLRAATHGRGIWEIIIPTPVQVASIVSRKTHSGAGVFDVDLPLGGSAGVECRVAGANNAHTLVFSFVNAVTVSGVTVAPGPGGTAEADGPPVVSANGQEVTVNLRNVSNAQTVTVTLNGVSNAAGTSNVTATMGILLGDTNGDGSVNSGDATQTRNRSGQTADAGTFRSDVNLDGTVNSGDAFIVRGRSGTAITP